MIPAAPSPLHCSAKRQSDTELHGSESFSVCVGELAHTRPLPHRGDSERYSQTSEVRTRGKNSDSSGLLLCHVPPLFHIVLHWDRLPRPSKYAVVPCGDTPVSKAGGLLRPFPGSRRPPYGSEP